MSLFYRKERIPETDAPPPPAHGVKRGWYLLRTHFSKFITLNLLLVLFSLPVVTMPAAMVACDRVLLQLWREGNCFLWHDFWETFREEFFRAMPAGLLGAFGTALAALGILLQNGAQGGATQAWIVSMLLFAGSALIAAVTSYAFDLLALMRLPLHGVFRNAVLMTMLEPKRTLLMLLSGGIALFAGGFFLPYTAPLWLLLLPVLWRFFVSSLAYGSIKARVPCGEGP